MKRLQGYKRQEKKEKNRRFVFEEPSGAEGGCAAAGDLNVP